MPTTYENNTRIAYKSCQFHTIHLILFEVCFIRNPFHPRKCLAFKLNSSDMYIRSFDGLLITQQNEDERDNSPKLIAPHIKMVC